MVISFVPMMRDDGSGIAFYQLTYKTKEGKIINLATTNPEYLSSEGFKKFQEKYR